MDEAWFLLRVSGHENVLNLLDFAIEEEAIEDEDLLKELQN